MIKFVLYTPDFVGIYCLKGGYENGKIRRKGI